MTRVMTVSVCLSLESTLSAVARSMLNARGGSMFNALGGSMFNARDTLSAFCTSLKVVETFQNSRSRRNRWGGMRDAVVF